MRKLLVALLVAGSLLGGTVGPVMALDTRLAPAGRGDPAVDVDTTASASAVCEVAGGNVPDTAPPCDNSAP